MKRKGNGVTITELHLRYFSEKLPRFLEVIPHGVFQKYYSQQTKTFANIAIKSPILTEWCNFEVFMIISLKCKIFAEVPFCKISVFYYK